MAADRDEWIRQVRDAYFSTADGIVALRALTEEDYSPGAKLSERIALVSVIGDLETALAKLSATFVGDL